jgi:precorrin-4/cobalt-precorrin-4 C11-methyltransferase
VGEQIAQCERLGLAVEIIPGVSAFTALAAAEHLELTVPEISQSVILTRLEGGKTPMPAGETIRAFASHGTTMAVFLSAARSGVLQSELLAGGYAEETPVVVGYQVSWADELIVWCTVATLAETTKQHKLWKHTLFLVGPGLASHHTRSHLYHPGHFHGFRKAEQEARLQLRAEHAAPPRGETGSPR